jgi:hypothetical protein
MKELATNAIRYHGQGKVSCPATRYMDKTERI